MKENIKNRKTIIGKVLSINMKKTAIIGMVSQSAHPIYKKIIKKNKKIKVDFGAILPKVGDRVKVSETRPLSKTKHFKIMEVIGDGSA